MFRPRLTVLLAVVLAGTAFGVRSQHITQALDMAYEDVQPVNGKGGSDISGPYVPVRNWPQPLEGGRMLSNAASVFPLSPDRVIVGVRRTRGPWPIAYNWDMREAFTVLGAQIGVAAFRDPEETHKLTVLDRNGKIIEYWKQWDKLRSIQFIRVNPDDPEGHVYVTGAGQIMKITSDGKRLVYTITSKDIPTRDGVGGFAPEGMTFHPDGSFYVVSRDRVLRFSEDGKLLSDFGKGGSGPGEFKGAHDLFLDREGGRLYVADKDNQRIQILDENGRYLDEWPNIVGASLVSMTADRKYIWVSSVYTAKFLKFDLNGRLQESWGTQGFGPGAITGGIHDFSTDSEGNLYIADHSNAVQKFSPRKDGKPAELIGQLLPY